MGGLFGGDDEYWAWSWDMNWRVFPGGFETSVTNRNSTLTLYRGWLKSRYDDASEAELFGVHKQSVPQKNKTNAWLILNGENLDKIITMPGWSKAA
jgi:hypothetical protein